MLRLWVSVALLALAGCGDGDPDVGPLGADAGATDLGAPGPERRRLDLVSESSLHLVAGEQARIEVRLLDADERPVAGEPVGFALVGRAQDASLADLSVTTDAEGMAANRLMGGQIVATFRVRVSAEGADDIHIDVASSDAGFGSLIVDAAYAGTRVLAQRVLTAQADSKCAEEPTEGDPTLTLTDMDEAMFLALPADTTYAVHGVASGLDGTVLARGCVDGVVVAADRDVRASLVWDDEPLQPVGTFELEAELDTTAPAASLGQSLSQTGDALVLDVAGVANAASAGAAFLLDSLDATLRGEEFADRSDYRALANAIAKERAMPTSAPSLDQTLQAMLDEAAHGPQVAIAGMAGFVEESLAHVSLAVEVTLDRDGHELPMAWRTLRVDAEPVPADAAVPTLDLSALDDNAAAEAVFRAGKDTVEITRVRFALPFGALAAQSLRTIASKETGLSREIFEQLGCGELVAWRAVQTVGPFVCHRDCIRQACDRAVARIVAAAEIAWLALDEQRPRVTLHGTLALEDDDGDLEVERMAADRLWGAWQAASDDTAADFISGSASATAASADPTGSP